VQGRLFNGTLASDLSELHEAKAIKYGTTAILETGKKVNRLREHLQKRKGGAILRKKMGGKVRKADAYFW